MFTKKSKPLSGKLNAFTALSGVAASLVGVGAHNDAEAQTAWVSNPGEVAVFDADRSGDPAILIDGQDTDVTIAGGTTISGTGNYREFPPTYDYYYTAGQGGINVWGTGGDINVEADATVIGENYGITTYDNILSDPRAEANITIVNDGDIIGKANDGIRIFHNVTVINNGTIVGARDVPGATDADFNNSLGDGISNATTGTQVIENFPADGVTLRVENYGVIDGWRMGIIGSSGGIVYNEGTIHGDSSGVLLQTPAQFGGPGVLLYPFMQARLTNLGSITATFQNGANVQSVSGEDDVFAVDLTELDTENITLFDDFDPAGAYAYLYNEGLIETFAESGDTTSGVVIDPVTGEQVVVEGQSEFYAVSMESANGYIGNAAGGTIRALNGANGVRLNAFDEVGQISGVIVFDNQGEVVGGVVGSDGQELVRNSGSIDGDVALGLGDDLFYLEGSVTGTIDLGGGDDIMVWHTTGSVGEIVTGGEGANTLALFLGGENFDAGRVFNFDTVFTYGGGDLDGVDLSLLPEIQVNEDVSLNIGSTGFGGIVVMDGGELVGIGEVDAIIIRGPATLAPGNSIGTINVVGNVDLAPASTYEVEVSPLGSDQILAGGAVTVDGAVTVTSENGVEVGPGAAQDSYVILRGDAGLTGAFSSFSEDFRFYAPTLTYTANEVVLNMIPVGADFISIAGSGTQAQLGALLYDALPTASGDLLDVLADSFPGLSDAEVREGLDAISGPAHGWAAVAASEVATQAGRIAARAPALASGEHQVWGAGFFNALEVDPSGGSVGADADVYGAVFGVNGGFGEHVNLGLFGGYATADGGDDAGGAIDGNSWFGGVQARARTASGFSAGAHIGYLNQNTDASRSISIGGLQRTANTDYNVEGWFMGGDVAWMKNVGAYQIGPFAEGALGGYEGDSFSETGADSLNLSSSGAEFTRAALRAGLRLTGDTGWMRPRIEAGVQAEDGDRAAYTPTTIAGVGSFTTRGPALDASAPFASLGADFALSSGMTISLGYDGVFGDSGSSHAAMARVGLNF
ncbi:MAG: autotransporter domain-containing protein [Hyphomonadaceae bacterium]